MATHSNILAWRIPWIEEPGRLQSTWSESDTTEATKHSYIYVHMHTYIQYTIIYSWPICIYYYYYWMVRSGNKNLEKAYSVFFSYFFMFYT